MKKYIVAGVEVSLLGQKITLNGVDVDNKPITKIAHVSRFRPILKAGAEFVMYNYREDEQTMVAQSYTANGKIYIDIPLFTYNEIKKERFFYEKKISYFIKCINVSFLWTTRANSTT